MAASPVTGDAGDHPRRRPLDARDVLTYLLLTLQLAGLVGAAVTLKDNVGTLQATAADIRVTLKEITAELRDHGERLRVLEDRANRGRDRP